MSATASPFDPQLQELFSDFAPARDLLLTANKRLSRFLVERYDALQSQHSYQSLNCLSYQAWLQQLWLDAQLRVSDGSVDRVLLTPLQEKLLWQRVVTEHADTPALINDHATALQAQRAWSLLHEWQLDRGQLLAIARAQQENLSFWRWVEDFEKRCSQHAWLCPSQLSQRLELLVESLSDVLPGRVFYYGFDVLSPAQQRWFDMLASRGCEVSELQLNVEDRDCRRAVFVDDADELKAAAAWASERLQDNPWQRLAVVVPDLVARRASVERIFQREFEPQYLLPGEAQHAAGFNISAAQPLEQMPLISAALQALRCGAGQLSEDGRMDIDRLSALLHSPFLGTTAERDARAALDVKLRKDGEPRVTFHKLRALASRQSEHGECEDWSARLSALGRLHSSLQGRRLPSEWVPQWVDLLKTWGWPGARTLDTLEYQQWQGWYEVLEEVCSLDAVLGRLDFAASVAILQQALQAKEFQAQTVSSPIQVLGLLEAAGLAFDAMWIVGMDDESWPAPPRPNPLLPVSVQREQQLPQSSPEREYEFAMRLQQRLAGSNAVVVASHAATKGDKAVSVSPLVEEWPELDWQPAAAARYEERLFASRDIEACLDHVGPRVADLDSIRGGSQIIKSQSHCPFQSFARFRLHSAEVQEPSQGLNAMERGNLVHHVMEVVWNTLKTHARLLENSDEELLGLIEKANEDAFALLKQRRFLGDRFIALESARLRELVMQWLRLEKQRPPFKVVLKEGRKTIKLEKLPINLRYDRVDKLEDGSLFVVDYKTGRTNVRDWAGLRPEEPQVPLYAVANARRASAAAFGQLNSDGVAFKGIAADPDVAPGLEDASDHSKMDLPDGWEQILEHWQVVLSRLVREFLAGTATVDPKDPVKTCRYCELHPLCRIREQFDFDAERDLAEEEVDE